MINSARTLVLQDIPHDPLSRLYSKVAQSEKLVLLAMTMGSSRAWRHTHGVGQVIQRARHALPLPRAECPRQRTRRAVVLPDARRASVPLRVECGRRREPKRKPGAQRSGEQATLARIEQRHPTSLRSLRARSDHARDPGLRRASHRGEAAGLAGRREACQFVARLASPPPTLVLVLAVDVEVAHDAAPRHKRSLQLLFAPDERGTHAPRARVVHEPHKQPLRGLEESGDVGKQEREEGVGALGVHQLPQARLVASLRPHELPAAQQGPPRRLPLLFVRIVLEALQRLVLLLSVPLVFGITVPTQTEMDSGTPR